MNNILPTSILAAAVVIGAWIVSKSIEREAGATLILAAATHCSTPGTKTTEAYSACNALAQVMYDRALLLAVE